jgi:GntR family transcriptional regulator
MGLFFFPMTVSRAYSLAQAEGLLERLRGRGMVVANVRRANLSESHRLTLLEPQLKTLARHASELELSAEPVLQRLARLMEG